jgi:4-amino-4-deoxy-L-arabinose transferase-like glycosyltransferase
MKSSDRLIWVFWIALFAIWFGTLNYRTLIRPDEGRYAEIPREMVASGNWITPRLNDIKYFEKPPLHYWATAAAYELLGKSNWSARFWVALTGFLGILLAAWSGRRLWGAQAGNMAAAILASTMLYAAMGQVTTLDMSLTFFLQLTWTAFLFAQQGEPRETRRWMLLAWAALGLAVLTKGLVALVLTGGSLILYSLLNRDLSPWKRLAPLPGLALFLAITAPWFIAVASANPEFAHFFFIHEHFERFLTKVHRRYAPDWYFLVVYILGAIPWTFMLGHAFIKSWRRESTAGFQAQRFLMIWVAVTFVFFSLSSSKLPPYILPIFPALALLGGRQLAGLSKRALLAHLAVLLPIVLIVLSLLPGQLANADTDYTHRMLSSYINWLMAGSAILLAMIVTAIAFAAKHKNAAAIIALAIGGFAGSYGVLLGSESLAISKSAAFIASKTISLLSPGVPFYSVRYYEQTLPFYLDRTVTLVEYRGEMAFGLKQEPEKWIPTVAEFKQRWTTDPDAFALMAIDTFDELAKEKLPMQEIARDTKNIIVRKPQ